MGIKLSTVCCAFCNARLPTEEDEFTGIRSEVKQRHRERIPLPFQDYLNRRKSELENDLSLNFLESRKIDYFNTDNRAMHLSAILKVQEIPQIPDPVDDFLTDFTHRSRRSISLHTKNKPVKSNFEIFRPNQRRSLEPLRILNLKARKFVNN